MVPAVKIPKPCPDLFDLDLSLLLNILRRSSPAFSQKKNPQTLPPITNGTTSTVHSVTAQPEGGAKDIVTRERMGHSKGIFLIKPENLPPRGIEPRTWRCYSEALNH
jgi:hypothetical protein